ncbi:MAG: hypothetical protein AB7H80_00585 [Candidatus Kapaibacterium sp.]
MLHFPGIVIPGHSTVAPPGQYMYSVRSSEVVFVVDIQDICPLPLGHLDPITSLS